MHCILDYNEIHGTGEKIRYIKIRKKSQLFVGTWKTVRYT